ncbi:hypothetical protein BJ742DRAFT_734493 [Cladochytrium replicatum]|nr:hypothetical protein BJ742DRAFT_734493 [Cladochytrium replicatum]
MRAAKAADSRRRKKCQKRVTFGFPAANKVPNVLLRTSQEEITPIQSRVVQVDQVEEVSQMNCGAEDVALRAPGSQIVRRGEDGRGGIRGISRSRSRAESVALRGDWAVVATSGSLGNCRQSWHHIHALNKLCSVWCGDPVVATTKRELLRYSTSAKAQHPMSLYPGHHGNAGKQQGTSEDSQGREISKRLGARQECQSVCTSPYWNSGSEVSISWSSQYFILKSPRWQGSPANVSIECFEGTNSDWATLGCYGEATGSQKSSLWTLSAAPTGAPTTGSSIGTTTTSLPPSSASVLSSSNDLSSQVHSLTTIVVIALSVLLLLVVVLGVLIVLGFRRRTQKDPIASIPNPVLSVSQSPRPLLADSPEHLALPTHIEVEAHDLRPQSGVSLSHIESSEGSTTQVQSQTSTPQYPTSPLLQDTVLLASGRPRSATSGSNLAPYTRRTSRTLFEDHPDPPLHKKNWARTASSRSGTGQPLQTYRAVPTIQPAEIPQEKEDSDDDGRASSVAVAAAPLSAKKDATLGALARQAKNGDPDALDELSRRFREASPLLSSSAAILDVLAEEENA